jgi:hypothetical protein
LPLLESGFLPPFAEPHRIPAGIFLHSPPPFEIIRKISFGLGIYLASADKYGRDVTKNLRIGALVDSGKEEIAALERGGLQLGTRVLKAGIFLLIFFLGGCFSNTEKTQYIVIQDGKKLQPYAKVVYQISADKQEVTYRIEPPGQERSKVYKLKKVIVTDENNWQGEADYILLWKIRVEMVSGKISSPGEGLANVNWFKWHFRTDPNPGPFSTMLSYALLLFMILTMVAGTLTALRIIQRRGRTAVRSSRRIKIQPPRG